MCQVYYFMRKVITFGSSWTAGRYPPSGDGGDVATAAKRWAAENG